MFMATATPAYRALRGLDMKQLLRIPYKKVTEEHFGPTRESNPRPLNRQSHTLTAKPSRCYVALDQQTFKLHKTYLVIVLCSFSLSVVPIATIFIRNIFRKDLNYFYKQAMFIQTSVKTVSIEDVYHQYLKLFSQKRIYV